ncbi:hypothetical protein [Paenirhodobacter sp. CAU 1674]|uniref:hypothetical protein n=1 Tax=Paenirhodobacter sp. CAU 1674 TaxID=3032596 RepID=UPI0023DBB3E8|nr:hypothetical protein [Paenirhodobacter sp. CAU 1674]MDF2140839.1 hypothetical protein [Paenirhodobacter sp. CAU 1674]
MVREAVISSANPRASDLRIFWHGARGCAVPRTRAEIDNLFPRADHGAVFAWISRLIGDQLLVESGRKDRDRIYEVTTIGARMAEAAWARHAATCGRGATSAQIGARCA